MKPYWFLTGDANACTNPKKHTR